MKTRIIQRIAISFLAVILFTGSGFAKGTERSALSHESTETTLELEEWMFELNSDDTGLAMLLEPAGEDTLELENWMTNPTLWEQEILIWIENAKEEALDLESWMTDKRFWER